MTISYLAWLFLGICITYEIYCNITFYTKAENKTFYLVNIWVGTIVKFILLLLSQPILMCASVTLSTIMHMKYAIPEEMNEIGKEHKIHYTYAYYLSIFIVNLGNLIGYYTFWWLA